MRDRAVNCPAAMRAVSSTSAPTRTSAPARWKRSAGMGGLPRIDRHPAMAGLFEQLPCLLRSFGTGRVVWQIRRRQLSPRLLNGSNDLPLSLDLIAAGEQRSVAAHGIEDQRLVGNGRIAPKEIGRASCRERV